MSGTEDHSSSAKAFPAPDHGHVSLGRPIRSLLFVVPVLLVALGLYYQFRPILELGPPPQLLIAPMLILISAMIIIGYLVKSVRVAAQWEKGVVLRLGKLHGIKGPGLLIVVPFIDYVRFIDTRTLTLNIPSQKVITRDNVPAMIDGVLFFLVSDPEKAVLKIQDFKFAISQYAQAALRDVVGGLTLDDLLSEREKIQNHIGELVEERAREWGVHVDSVRLLDIEMPEDLKRMMSRQASAEREKRATITKAEGDRLAAVNLAEAAAIMQRNPGAMQLRALQTIDGLGPSPSNTVVLFPVEMSDVLRTLALRLSHKDFEMPEVPRE